MAFLKPEDYDNQINPDVLAEIAPAGITAEQEQQAIDEITGYINQRYVPGVLFSGSNRSSILVMYTVDIVLYHAHSSINSRDIPVLRETRYKQALAWLKEVMLGRINPPNWPRIEDEDGKGNEVGSRYGSSWYKGIQPH